MSTTTERLPSGFTAPAPTAAQVREDVARAVAGLEALHGEIARRRREIEEEDRQLEDLERELTARVAGPAPAPPEPARNGTNGVHAGAEALDDDDPDALEIELGKLSWDDPDPELDACWAPVETHRPAGARPWDRVLAETLEVAEGLSELGREITEAAAGTDARDEGHDVPTDPPVGPAAELGQEAPAPVQPGQDGRELGEARQEAAASTKGEPGPVDRDAALLVAIRRYVGDPRELLNLSNGAILDRLGEFGTGSDKPGRAGGIAWATYGRREVEPFGPAFFAGDDVRHWPYGEPTLKGDDLAKAARKVAKRAREELKAAAPPKVELDVDDLLEATYTESQGPGEPDDEPDEVLDLAVEPGPVAEELPVDGPAGDWRGTTLRSLIALTVKPRWIDSLVECLRDIEVNTVGDLCTFLTDEGQELDDITTIPDVRAELCRALEVFRRSQGWDDSTQYPAGIPAGWFELEEPEAALVPVVNTKPEWGTAGELSLSVSLESSASVAFRIVYKPGAGFGGDGLDFHWGMMDKRFRSLHTNPKPEVSLEEFCRGAARHLLVVGGNPCRELEPVATWRKLGVEVLGLKDAYVKSLARAGLKTQGDLWDSWFHFHWQTIAQDKMPSHVCLEAAEKMINAFVRSRKDTAPDRPAAAGKTTPAPKPAGAEKKKKNRDVPRELVLERLEKALEPKSRDWERLRKHGAKDELLKETIGRRFDKHSRGEDWSVRGGAEPKMWATSSGSDPTTKKKADLEGTKLIVNARLILEIALPDDARPGPAAKPMAGKGKPRALPTGATWTAATLCEARERLDWRSHDESLFVCDKLSCSALFYSYPGKSEPCPECGGRKRHTYTEQEARIKKAEQLADTSHGFAAPAKSGAIAKPKSDANAWDRRQVGTIKLAERSPVGSLNGAIVAALELEHPHWSARWAERQKTGASDKEILDALKSQWPFAPRFTAPPKGEGMAGFTVQGGKSPGFWQGAKKKTNEPPALEGNPLAWRVRAILGIGLKDKAPKPAKSKPTARSKTGGKPVPLDDVIDEPDPHQFHFVPEPIGKWSLPKMGEAAGEILGNDHRESVRDAALVVCNACQAMRRRGVAQCPPCGVDQYRSYAAVRAEVIHAGKKVMAKSMAADRAASRGDDD